MGREMGEPDGELSWAVLRAAPRAGVAGLTRKNSAELGWGVVKRPPSHVKI
jgi:hypothetical protein